ncbi:MAG: sensor histidine kinase [Spirochaetaceae bacterium]
MAVSTDSMKAEPRIVFVDDEHEILDVAERLFRTEPYECLTFTRPPEALEFLRHNQAHVVVSDLRMPDMDGFRFLKEVTEVAPYATRVVLSAHSDSRSLLEAINQDHVHRYVVKPWDAADFISVIRQSVELASLKYERETLLETLAENSDQLTERVMALRRPAELGKYASQIVHNLKAPIQTIGSAVFLANLLVDHEDPNGAQLQTYLDHIADGARNLQRIVAGILLHTMDESFFREEPINLNDIVEREIAFFEIDRSFKYRVERRIFLDPELPTIRGNALQFKQIVDVLIRNATDAMLESERRVLTVTTGTKGQRVYLSVEDSGVGIPKESLGELFSPFFSTKELGAGTGIGLASARQLVEAYAGSIEVESELGCGARFTVFLPT